MQDRNKIMDLTANIKYQDFFSSLTGNSITDSDSDSDSATNS